MARNQAVLSVENLQKMKITKTAADRPPFSFAILKLGIDKSFLVGDDPATTYSNAIAFINKLHAASLDLMVEEDGTFYINYKLMQHGLEMFLRQLVEFEAKYDTKRVDPLLLVSHSLIQFRGASHTPFYGSQDRYNCGGLFIVGAMYSVNEEGIQRLNVDAFEPNEEIQNFISHATAAEAIPTQAPPTPPTAQQRAANQVRIFR